MIRERGRLQQLIVDARWKGHNGISRFASEVTRRIPRCRRFRAAIPLLHPAEPVLLNLALRCMGPAVYYTPGYNPPWGEPVRFVFTMHDLNHLHVPENANAIKLAYYARVLRPACQRAFSVLTVSEFSRQQILEWSGLPEARVVNVGNGVGESFSPAGAVFNPGYPYLFYIGNRRPHKNIPRLLEAFARSGVSGRVKLLLSGGPDRPTLALLRRLNLEAKVDFTGAIPDRLLPAYYRGATALVFASLYEGFGLPIAEAMACGAPVVTSNRGALREVAGNAALLVDPTEVEDIAAGIARIVDDEALRTRLRMLSLSRAGEFSWEETARRVIAVLEQALDRHAA